MPELTTTTAELERREILHEIVSLYLEKDIKSLLREEELLGYNQFIRLLCNRIGQLMNRAEYSRVLGISTRQVAKQLQVMEHTFVLRPVSTDYTNPTKRLVRAPRLYWYDNGLRNALVRDLRPRRDRPDAGALLENHIFTELEKAADIGTQILFHRTHDQQEIDFVLERDRQKILVEVKSAWARPRKAFRTPLRSRTTSSLVCCSRTLACRTSLRVLTPSSK
jgi:predicted AAA+ superfamily ATPase